MTVPRIKRFAIEHILAPRSVTVIGTGTEAAVCVNRNLREGGFKGQILAPGEGEPDLAVIVAPPEAVPAAMRQVAACRGGAAVVTSVVPNLAALVAETGVRALGPSSFGVALPRLGLNVSLSHMPVPRGNIALVTQSAALARTVVDWAGPNGVGFSAIVGVNGNANFGFAVIDHLSRDPETKLIMLDIRQVRSRRAFVSAARAASRLRPVVALRPGERLIDPGGRTEAVSEAALKRAGIFAVHRLDSFLAAAETFSRCAPLRQDSMAVVTNGIGPGRLAADAALANGIQLATLPPDSLAGLRATLPAELIQGLIYAGGGLPTDLGSVAAMVSAVPGVGGILVLLAPCGEGSPAAVESIIAAAHTAKLPVLSCIMGETSGAAHRRRIAEAGLPAFATPEQAVQAFRHLLRDRQAKRAMRELPGSRMLEVAPDHAAAQALVRAARAGSREAMTVEETRRMLACYGLHVKSTPGPEMGAGLARISIRTHDDAMFGPAIGCGMSPEGRAAYDLPPLNLALADGLAARAGLSEPAQRVLVADILVRVSQMLVDLPEIAALAVDPVVLSPQGAELLDAALWLRPPGERAELAISPYPEQLEELWTAKGETFLVRPIRPEDAEAHAEFITRVPPDDLRYRFFSARRSISAEQMVRLTQIDYDREIAFVAVRQRDKATVGVSRLVRELDGRRGEFAILVQPDTKGFGLARHLMQRLIDWAKLQGIPEVFGQVLADNAPMLGFVRRLGFTVRGIPDESDVMECVLAVQG